MPLRLNVGLQKKVGLPDYGSRGASAAMMKAMVQGVPALVGGCALAGAADRRGPGALMMLNRDLCRRFVLSHVSCNSRSYA